MEDKKKLFLWGFIILGCYFLIMNTLRSHREYDLYEIEKLRDEYIIYDKDFDVRITPFHRDVKFDPLTTPVQNMMRILQNIDSFNLCDEDWYIEMNENIQDMKDQYLFHHNSVDPYIQKLMAYQLTLIQKMDVLVREADSDNVLEMEKAFKEYQDYYLASYRSKGE